MKHLIYKALNTPELVEEPAPECTRETMLLKTLYSGVSNGTERNQLNGGNYNSAGFPHRRIGYQAVSEVVECGDGVQRFSKGDIVATGTFGTHAAYHLAQDSDLVTKLPDGFDLQTGALISVASVAYHNVRRMGVNDSDKVLVCGAGVIGQVAAQVCKGLGAETFMLSRGEARARIAESLGVDGICFGDESKQDAFLENLKPLTVAIETSGSAHLLQKLIGTSWGDGMFVRGKHNRLCILAGNDEITYTCNAAQAAQLSIMHSGHFDLPDQEAVIDLMHTGKLKIRPLIQDVIPASEAVSVFQTLLDNPSSLFGTILDWT